MSARAKTVLPPPPAFADVARSVDDAITSRRSVRAFLPAPVPQALVERILEVAARAPSGTNMQPWRVYVSAGEAKEKLSRAILDSYESGEKGHKRTWKYYPDEFFDPYLSRRRAVGWGLYNLLGIAKGETEKMKIQRGENYKFFGAPVGMIFTIDSRLEIGSWLDYGMFIGNVMTSARGHGLHSCPQAAFADYHAIIRQHLGIPESETVICGLSLGYEDTSAVANRLRTDRAPLADFVRFTGFES
ncbi:MAG: nitroreductase [Alphaproteobacteria bacterium]